MYPFDNTIKGKSAFTKGTNVRVRSMPSTSGSILATNPANNTFVGTLTGTHTMPVKSEIWYEILLTSGKKGWIRNDVMTMAGNANTTTVPYNPAITTPVSNTSGKNTKDDAEAQRLIDEILAQDKQTLNNLNEASALIEQLKAKGVNTTSSENQLKKLTTSVLSRQRELEKSTWAKVKDKITNAWGSIKKFFGFSGLGILPVVAIAAVALVAGSGATALIILKPWKNQSTIDLKESKELRDLLNKADPKTATKIREDLKSQVVDAYTTGNRQGTWGSYGKILTYAAVAVFALWGVPRLMDILDHKKRK